MPGFSLAFSSARATEPDPVALLAQLRALDATAGVHHLAGSSTYVLKKLTAWTGPQITAAQNAIDTAPAVTPQSVAQTEIDNWPISLRSLVDVLRDENNILRAEINTLRAAVSPPLTPPLTPRTRAQALQAVRDKAATLS